MTANKQLVHFISRFQLLIFSITFVFTICSYGILQSFSAQNYLFMCVSTLCLRSVLLKKFGYFMDVYNKVTIVSAGFALLAVILSIASVYDVAWLHVVLFITATLLVEPFFAIMSSLSQTLAEKNTLFISTSMELVNKLNALLLSVFVWALFDDLGMQDMYLIASLVTLVGIFVIQDVDTFCTVATNEVQQQTQTSKTKANQTQANSDSLQSLGFTWVFSQPIIVFVGLTLACNVMVLLSNDINSIYIYQVLAGTPEIISLTIGCFSVGSIVSALICFCLSNEKRMIQISFVMSAIASVFIASMPSVYTFMVVMFIFGLGNNTTRIMMRSLIMQTMPSQSVATFYGLISSMSSAIWCTMLILATAISHFVSVELIVWCYPMLILVVPLVALAQKYTLAKNI